MRLLVAAVAVCLVFFSGIAKAEVAESSAGGFLLRSEAIVAATPDQAYRALAHLPDWWDSAHTYSGDAPRFMRFDLQAGGCLCERWRGNSVEHARVVMLMNKDGVRTVRLAGAFGPLQEMGASGVMTYTIAPDPNGAKLTLTYRVSGDPSFNFAELAPLVDHVLSEQFARFIRYTSGDAPS